MVHVYRFAAVRPGKGHAQEIASVPYDVVNDEEAREMIQKNPLCFLRISRSDALMPDTDPYADIVYKTARETYQNYCREGLLVGDPHPAIYIYRVLQGRDQYTGLCCCLDVRDYESGIIKRHELTRYEKEEDRTRHIDTVNANTGPVVLLYQAHREISAIIDTAIRNASHPDVEVRGPCESVHQIYPITDPSVLDRLESLFSAVRGLYIADGHHRAKSAVNVAQKREAGGSVPIETRRFMGVLFADDEVRVHGYSRLLSELNGNTEVSFIDALRSVFTVIPYGIVDGQTFRIHPHVDPLSYHVIHLYMDGLWYECSCQRDRNTDTINGLDVTYLQDHVLTPILGISDPRGDPRLQYLGGARPLADLEARVDSGEYMAAIAMQPVGVGTVFAIADAGCVMPPKSTWFEPKLLSGLLIHELS